LWVFKRKDYKSDVFKKGIAVLWTKNVARSLDRQVYIQELSNLAMRRITLLAYIILFPLFVIGQSASFTFQSSNGLFCNPATISFTQTCTGNPLGFNWSFGNGQFSSDANPATVFATAGTYTVKLVAIFDAEVIETSQTIVVNASITGSLTATRNYICTAGNIDFTAITSGSIATYEWDFGDGTALTTTTNASISHSYSSFGVFNAVVKAIDLGGCFVNCPYTITVQKAPIVGTISPINGCIPALVNFGNIVTLPIGDAVTNYEWNFGDGSPLSNTVSGTNTHSYAAVGTYNPSVSITTNEGCTNTFNFQAISFGTPPTNHVAFSDKITYCGSETPIFIAKAINANSYIWNYGDGITETVLDTITQHKYATLGLKTVTVTPYFNGCAGTAISFQITITGVIASYTYNNTCASKRTFTFINNTQGNQSTVLWNFGDGTPTASTTNATHTYPLTGSFITSLTVTDNITGCVDVFSASIYTATPSLTNPDTSICKNSATTFSIQNNYANNAAVYNWFVVGLPLVSNSIKPYTTNAPILGNFSSNYVVINNGAQYCTDTIKLNHNMLVRGPNLSFTADANICTKSAYNIINTSSAFVPTDSVVLWSWNYGIVPKSDTIFQPKPYAYPGPGLYFIKLIARDKTGCIDSLQKQVNVKPIPFLRIFPRNDTLCFGQSDTIIAFHSDTLSWMPLGALSCANCDTVIANPTITTLFYATANNSFNCKIVDSTLFTVFTPFTATPAASPVYVCALDSVRISANPPNKRIVWSPLINISDSTSYNPIVSPPSATTYMATLTDSVGCFSSTTKVDVIVKSLPIVNAGPDKVYPYNTAFTISPTYSSNIVSYDWAPAPTLSCSNCGTPSGVALESKTYTIKVKSDSGCVAKDDITIYVECAYANLFMPTAFSPNRDGKNDIYYPITRGIRVINRFSVFNRVGQMLFDSKNFIPNNKKIGWDGRYKGLDQSGEAYVFILEAVCDLGETIVKKGSFLLLR
jgi:gliding motility-associated-like protein